LGRFSICHLLPPPATIQYATFHATFYATTQKRTLTAATGQKDSNHHRQIARWVVELLSMKLGISTDDIEVVSSYSSPSKVIAIIGMDDEAIRSGYCPTS
jgi:hypothetical protein